MQRELTMRGLPEELRRGIVPVLKRHGVTRAAVFGSFATGRARDDSDLDILVEFGEDQSLLDLVALQLDLENLLHRGVDIITYEALHPEIRERVLQEQVAIL